MIEDIAKKSLMSKSAGYSVNKVLFLGPEGTYSHQAALQQFGDNPEFEFLCAKSIPDCFERLENDATIAYAVVPLENSTNGQVVFTYDLLRDRMAEQSHGYGDSNQVESNLEVVGEQYVSIMHCLMSSSPVDMKSLPNYKRIKIHSHPQVWGQVTTYLQDLKTRCPQTLLELVDAPSTSEAVKRALEAEASLGEESVLNLAIASKTAANIHNAHIIDQGINDKHGNTTRFLIIRRGSAITSESNISQNQVTLLSFTIKQDDPGSLVDTLVVLKNHSVNMCSISSRPLVADPQGKKWQYVFFIEYYGNKKTDWNAFYNDISASCTQWCLWGTFARNEVYFS